MKLRQFFFIFVFLTCSSLRADAVNDGDEDGEEEQKEILDPPFIAYAKIGNTDALKFLLDNTKSKEERTQMLNTLDKKDRSGLVWALRRNRIETAEFLLKEGIDVMHKDCQNLYV